MLLDRLFGRLSFAAHAHAEHHLKRDREQQQPAGDAEGGQRNAERAKQDIAEERGADQDCAGDEACAHGDIAACAARQALGDREEGRRESNRIDHHKQCHKRRYGEIERHPDQFLSRLGQGRLGGRKVVGK